MNFAVVAFALVCALSQFGNVSPFTPEQVKAITTFARQKLEVITLPTRNRIQTEIGPIGKFITFPATVSLKNGKVYGVNNFNLRNHGAVDGKPQRFNITLSIDKVTYEIDYKLQASFSNKGHVDGEFYDVKMNYLLDITSSKVKLASPVSLDIGDHEIYFSKGDHIVDFLFNLYHGVFFKTAKELAEKIYLDNVVKAIVTAANESINKIK